MILDSSIDIDDTQKALLEALSDMAASPKSKYKEAQTSAQDYGWVSDPLVPRSSQFHYGMKSSEVSIPSMGRFLVSRPTLEFISSQILQVLLIIHILDSCRLPLMPMPISSPSVYPHSPIRAVRSKFSTPANTKLNVAGGRGIIHGVQGCAHVSRPADLLCINDIVVIYFNYTCKSYSTLYDTTEVQHVSRTVRELASPDLLQRSMSDWQYAWVRWCSDIEAPAGAGLNVARGGRVWPRYTGPGVAWAHTRGRPVHWAR